MKIYTDETTSIDVQVSEGKKWYTYVLPKDKGLYQIVGDSVKNVVLKANITTSGETIIPYSTVEASFKGSDTSKITNMYSMFDSYSGLTSLDLSGWDTSNVTSMYNMFRGCTSLTSIRMVGCEKPTIDKIKAQLTADGISLDNVKFITK